MRSEGAGALPRHPQGGALATFAASQGLLLTIPSMFRIDEFAASAILKRRSTRPIRAG